MQPESTFICRANIWYVGCNSLETAFGSVSFGSVSLLLKKLLTILYVFPELSIRLLPLRCVVACFPSVTAGKDMLFSCLDEVINRERSEGILQKINPQTNRKG